MNVTIEKKASGKRGAAQDARPAPSPEDVEFGRRIRAARKARGMAQEDLARALGMRVGIVSRWERGANLPRMQTLRKVAEVLEQDIAYFTTALDGSAPANGSGLAVSLEELKEEVSELRELLEQALADRARKP